MVQLPEKEAQKLWRNRKKDWHKEPGSLNVREERWYNLVYCVKARVTRDILGNEISVAVFSAI